MKNTLVRQPGISQIIGQDNEEASKILCKTSWHRLLKYAVTDIKDGYVCKETVQKLFVHRHASSPRLKVYSSISPDSFVSVRNYLRNRSVCKRYVNDLGATGGIEPWRGYH